MAFFSKPPKTTSADWEADHLEDDLPELAESAAKAVSIPMAQDNAKPRRRTPTTPAAAVDQVQDHGGELPDVDTRLRSLARQVRGERKRLAVSAIRIGQALSEAQALLADYGNGTFGKWLADSCGIGRRSAYQYIACAKVFGACEADTQARFELSAMVLLSRDSTPAAARSEALKLAGAKTAVTTKLARSLVAKHSPTKPTRSKPLSVVAGGGAVVVKHKPGEDPVRILEAALAELRKTRSAAAA